MTAVVKMKTDWHKPVYRKRKIQKFPENWHEIRRDILERDGHKCFRCLAGKRKQLTVHHLIPRADGGGENYENLITLCSNCHDFAEIEGLRTLTAIEASISQVEIEEIQEAGKQDEDAARKESFARPDWHRWVYGGAKAPQ